MKDDVRSPGLRFEILGPLSVSSDVTKVDLGAPRQRALLALLLIHVGSVVSLPVIINAIWGSNPPSKVTGTLQAYVSRLRKLLHEHDRSIRLVHHLQGYLLEADAQLVDAAVFEAKARDCRELLKSGDLEVARSTAWSALELWKGTPMGELYGYDFAVAEADRLEHLRLRVLEVWAQACLELHAYGEVTLRLGEELCRNPGLERLGGQLMVAQYHSGQSADALLTYERMRNAVAEDLGADLSRELQALHGKILRQELEASPVSESAGRTAPAPGSAPVPAPPESKKPAPSVSPQPGDRLIGRQAEMQRLERLLAGARSGRGHLLLVCGEQGIGKTRLLQHSERCLAASGFRTVRSQCIGALSAPGYWTWDHVVRQLEVASDASMAVAADLVAHEDWLPEQHLTHQMRIVQAVLSAAERTPAVLLLEDLHLAPVPALEVLQLLVKQIIRARVMILATLRDHELAKNPAVRRAVGRILQESSSSLLRLEGLAEEESHELIASASGAAPSPNEALRLQRASGGNPFLLLSMVSAQTTGKRLQRSSVPLELREMLHGRLSECSPGTLDVLTLCAVIGMSVHRPLLADLLSTLELPHTLIDDAVQTGLLRHDRTADGRLSFVHGLTRDFLLDDTQPVTLARWHQHVATTLALRFQPGDDAAEIRRHCLAAARLLGARMGVRPLLTLADREQARFAHAAALHWLEGAASVVAALPGDQQTSALKLQLRKRMIRLHALIEGYGSDRVEKILWHAQQLERTFDRTQPTGLLHIQAMSAITAGQYSQAAEIAVLLYELADHGGGRAARSAACYVEGVTLYVSGRPDEALGALTQGVEIIDSLLDASCAPTRLSALLRDQRIDYRAYLALSHCLRGDEIQTQRYRSQLLHLTRSDRYIRPWDRAFARYVDALIAITEDDVQRAWLAGRAGRDLAVRCRLPFWHRMLAVPLGWAEVHQGMHERGLARMRKALHDSARHRTLLRRTLHLGLLADALHRMGAHDEARRTITSAAEEIEERDEYFCFLPQWPFARLLGESDTGSTAAHQVDHERRLIGMSRVGDGRGGFCSVSSPRRFK
ncbi:AAA family ATPase [Streptomyces sp. NA02950]|uniref:BTAD domain-containing putative transcriptional regulator n=1 Tax=Streptomyces sp. NA02950 TaxID=2742137 RepID=UPI0015917AA6|nr:BTAD domain-containing putative transcriptional regulator [Streptomyces sp. NA02950]QKV98120.1 AAA family ATPase [Streptomyces sp. NA02950]